MRITHPSHDPAPLTPSASGRLLIAFMLSTVLYAWGQVDVRVPGPRSGAGASVRLAAQAESRVCRPASPGCKRTPEHSPYVGHHSAPLPSLTADAFRLRQVMLARIGGLYGP